MRGRGAILLAAVAASSCTCQSPPAPVADAAGPREVAPPVRGPARHALEGRVLLPPRPDGTLSPVYLWLVPEADAIPVVEAKLAEARATLARTERQRAALRREAEEALAASDEADQEWRRAMSRDLRGRVELVMRRPRDAAEARATQAELNARKREAYGRAAAAARRSREAERELEPWEAEARRLRDARWFAQGMPPGQVAGRSGPDGRFALDVASGRYALVAIPEGMGARPPGPAWLLWVEVREGEREPLLLDARNQHGTDCLACVVQPREIP